MIYFQSVISDLHIISTNTTNSNKIRISSSANTLVDRCPLRYKIYNTRIYFKID